MSHFEASKSFEIVSSFPTVKFSIDVHYTQLKYNVKIYTDGTETYSNTGMATLQDTIYFILARIQYHYPLSFISKVVLICQLHKEFKDAMKEADIEWNKNFIPRLRENMTYSYAMEDLNLIFLEFNGNSYHEDQRFEKTLNILEDYYGKSFAEKFYERD